MNGLMVIKIGGGEGIELAPILHEVADLVHAGQRVVLVHGGSHETNELAEQLGHAPRWITSPSGHTSRRTDRRTLEIFEMVYCGKVNKGIVETLRARAVDAVGLSGLDGGIWLGERKNAIRSVEEGRTVIIRDDLTGAVKSVDRSFLSLILDAGRTPVLTPPAVPITIASIPWPRRLRPIPRLPVVPARRPAIRREHHRVGAAPAMRLAPHDERRLCRTTE